MPKTDYQKALQQLAKASVQHKVNFGVMIEDLRTECRRLKPDKFWIRHRKGCTKEMRERTHERIKNEVRKGLATPPPLERCGLSAADVRRLTKHSH